MTKKKKKQEVKKSTSCFQKFYPAVQKDWTKKKEKKKDEKTDGGKTELQNKETGTAE